jgi:hypothetical protein
MILILEPKTREKINKTEINQGRHTGKRRQETPQRKQRQDTLSRMSNREKCHQSLDKKETQTDHHFEMPPMRKESSQARCLLLING